MVCRPLALAAACLLAGTAHATTLFSDNFDANPLGLNAVPAGWTVTDGTVDIIGSPGFFDFLPGNGRYIDLDGSTGNAGVLSTSLLLTGGIGYTASFQLAGSHRGSIETVTVSFGGASQQFVLGSAAGFTSFSLSFTPAVSGAYMLSFSNAGGDNIGALLDNVQVTAVPEPGTYALLLGGLAALGGWARRRRAG